jgi:hypothetical protein
LPCSLLNPCPLDNNIIPHLMENVKRFLKKFSTDQSQIFELVGYCQMPQETEQKFSRARSRTRSHRNSILLASGVIEKVVEHSMYPPFGFIN